MSDVDHASTAETDRPRIVWVPWDDEPVPDPDDFDANNCPKCGSDNVDWSDAGYYCMHCGAMGR